MRAYLYNKDDFGCYIRVTDTPGFGDSQFKDQTFFPVIQNAIKDVATHKGGVHAILMVFKITAKYESRKEKKKKKN